MRRLLSILLFLAVPASALSACKLSECTDASCRDGVNITAYTAANLGELSPEGTIEVCRNGRCATGAFVEPGVFSLEGEIVASGTVSYVNARRSVVEMRLGLSARELRGGDRYRIAIKDRSGRTLLDEESVANYETVHPNGPDCKPECTAASMTFPSSVTSYAASSSPAP